MIVSLGSTSLLIYASQGKAEPAAVTAAAGAAAICAGIGKELFDRLGFGTPEFRDLLNTAFGGLIGISAIAFSFSAFPPQNVRGIESDLRYTFLSLSLALSLPILQHLYAGE